MKITSKISEKVLVVLAIAGVVAALMVVVYLGISIFWLFAAAGFVM